MDKKVLIISSHLPLMQERVVTGIGLRMYGLAQGLKLSGYRIVYAIWANRVYHEGNLPAELTANSYTCGNLRQIVEDIKPDIILKEWWGYEDNQFDGLSIPIIFDLPAPRLLEEVYHGQFPESMFIEKIRSLSKGDYFICCSPLHKAYYLPFLMMSGVDTRQDVIRVVPHSTDLEHHLYSNENLRFVFGGIYWPWQDPIRALNILINLMEEHRKGSLHIYCGTFPYNNEYRQKYFNPVPHLIKSERVRISGLLPYEIMRNEFCKASVAMDVMERNLERDMSFSFRTLDYLACGLPVIVSKYGEWSRWIRDWRAGWVVDPESEEEIKTAIETVMHEPEMIMEYSENARNLIRDNFTYEKTVEPLARFCQRPVKRHGSRSPMSSLISMEMGKTMRKRRLFQEALKSFRECVDGKNTPEWVYLEIGITLIEQGNFNQAEKEIIMEERLYPGKADTKNSLGVIYRKQERYEEAIKAFKKAIEINPYMEWVHIERALTYAEIYRYEDAFNDLNIEERFYPGKAETKNSLGIIYRKQERYKDAIEAFQKAIDLNPSFEWPYLEIGITYRKQRRYEDAIKTFQRAIDLNPLFEWVHLEIGITCIEIEKIDKAIYELSTALRLNTYNILARYNLSSIFVSVDRLAEARTGFLEIIESSLSSPVLKGGSCFHLGRISLKEGNNKDAAVYFKRCLEFIPDHRKASCYLHERHKSHK